MKKTKGSRISEALWFFRLPRLSFYFLYSFFDPWFYFCILSFVLGILALGSLYSILIPSHS